MIRIRHHALLLFVLFIIAGLSLMAGLAWGFVEVVRLCRRGSPDELSGKGGRIVTEPEVMEDGDVAD